MPSFFLRAAALAALAAAAQGARRARNYLPLGARTYSGVGPISNPEEWVNTLGGTKSIGGQEDSFGNVLPEVRHSTGAVAGALRPAR